MTEAWPMTSPRPEQRIDLTVVAPGYNERSNIDALVDRTLAVFDGLGATAELVLIDDGSTDDTWSRIADRSGHHPRVRGVRHPANLGMEAGWRTGLTHAAGALICLIDADLQNQPEDIPSLLEHHRRERCDVVQGVRRSTDPPVGRYLMSRALNLLLNLTFQMRSRDNKSGFILCKREVLARMLEHRFRYRFFQSVLGAAVKTRGFTIGEIDTAFAPRAGGQSFLRRFPVRAILWTIWEIVKFRVETLIERPKSETASRGGSIEANLTARA